MKGYGATNFYEGYVCVAAVIATRFIFIAFKLQRLIFMYLQ